MTVAATTRKAGPYNGDGGNVTFAFSFKIFATTDVVVTKTDAASVETVKAITVDYTVAMNVDQNVSPGGSITMLVAPAIGEKITLSSSVPESQGTSLPTGSNWAAKVVETALDKLTALYQQIIEKIGRGLRVPISDGAATVDLPTAANRASKVLGFDALGQPTTYSPASAVTAAGNVTVIQAGVGAVAGTAENQFRKFCFLSDYDTVGHFNTAKAALTDTAAFCKLSIVGNSEGSLAISGDFYNHAVCTLGFNSSPLNQTHQVGFLSLLQANSSAAGAGSFHAAFEGQCGTVAGAYTLAELTVFQTGSVTKGAGTTITRTRGLSVYEETAGVNNAMVALSTSAFTGDWFLFYDGVRPSNISRNIVSPGEIYRDTASSYVRVSGGISAADGASIIAFGSAHATNANQVQLNASGGITAGLGSLKVTHATGGLGYGTGAGGTVAQGAGSGKATAVTLNTSTGEITMNNAALNAGTIVTFVFNCAAIAAADMLVCTHHSAGTTGAYTINGRATGAGTAAIDVRNNTAGNLSEAIVIKFAVLKAATA